MTDDPEIKTFFADFPRYTEEDRTLISAAYRYASERGQPATRSSGERWIAHPLRVARIIAGLGLDAEAVACALLHGLSSPESGDAFNKELETVFSPTIARLVDGTSRISGLKMRNKTIQQAEAIRKMFFAMVDDLRIILVRLADRLDKMRTLKAYPEDERKRIAQETVDIWAPLANRLGIAPIKVELEDLGLKYTNREVYDQIKNLVAAKKNERSEFLIRAETELVQAAARAGINISVKSRAKHFWSIYQKMKKRNKAADELFDLLAMRVICPTPNDCYAVLGLVHSIWKPLDGRFKDYIAMPKSNGYQSLHTTVMSIEGMPLEIQIRTPDMHQIAESGVASHWLYKKGTSKESVSAETIPVVNRLRELAKSGFTGEDFLVQIKADLLGDSIFVFTPRGDIIELPSGSTPIDFAYTIHSAVGEKIVGAKANGAIIPLSQALKNTQVVEIITHPQARPTINQYHSVRTAKARQKIRSWLQEHDPGVVFEKKEVSETDKQGETQRQAVHHKGLLSLHGAPETVPQFDSAVLKIRVGDTTNFLIKFANCCSPKPPSPIIGYVSRGRGIIIHRTDCTNLGKIPEISNRSIPVEWELPPDEKKPAKSGKK
jgi:GTP pyrophosphokinase